MSPTPFINPTSFQPAKFGTIASLLNLITPVLMIGGGIIFFGMIVYAGFLYINSQGKTENLKKIQQLFIYAIIGFVVILSSFLVIRLLGVIFNLGPLPF
ncbi:MAG: hypothetical protein HYW86_01115 [Candidatus Roizmanbacteria bacterium]|nr:MAG: hypothetical protein HYW86_01115 [Candidatus Roizmanbacteria bacterium]